MPDRFLDAYDEADARLKEAIWEKYASGDRHQAICRELSGLRAAWAARTTELPHAVSPQPSDPLVSVWKVSVP